MTWFLEVESIDGEFYERAGLVPFTETASRLLLGAGLATSAVYDEEGDPFTIVFLTPEEMVQDQRNGRG